MEEREFGVFVPVWRAGEGPWRWLEWVEAMPEVVVQEPYVLRWPWGEGEGRQTPTMGRILKERRMRGKEGGLVVSVPRAGVPGVRVDRRKWPGVEVREAALGEALSWGPGSVGVLVTPLGLQEAEGREGLVRRVWEVLEEGGVWWLVDVLPVSMAGH